MDTAVATTIATIIAALISGVVGWATKNSAAKAAVINQTTASRTEIEKEAFERAKSFYSGALDRAESEIERQDREIIILRGEVVELRSEVSELRHTVALRDSEIRRLAAIVAERGST